MDANPVQAIFTDEAKAREWLESYVWPNGPVCPHCGTDRESITALRGEAYRRGVYQCNACRQQFTVTVKTVFEKSKIPLSKWLTLLFLMAGSKNGVSAHQVYRALGVSYKSTWFMCHRLREAMRLAKYTRSRVSLEETVDVGKTPIGGNSGEPRKLPGSGQARPGPDGLSRLPRPRKRQSLNRVYVRDDAHVRSAPAVVKV